MPKGRTSGELVDFIVPCPVCKASPGIECTSIVSGCVISGHAARLAKQKAEERRIEMEDYGDD